MPTETKIKISVPMFDKAEVQAVVLVLKSGSISQGDVVAEFERKFAEYIGTKHVVTISSGTSALYLSLMALNVRKDHKVITTPFSVSLGDG